MKLFTTLPDGREVEVNQYRNGRYLVAPDCDLPDHVAHHYFKGFALAVYGRTCYSDDDSNWSGIVNCDPDTITVCMVGDDMIYSVPLSECTPLTDDDEDGNPAFCHTCGQLGCTHGR